MVTEAGADTGRHILNTFFKTGERLGHFEGVVVVHSIMDGPRDEQAAETGVVARQGIERDAFLGLHKSFFHSSFEYSAWVR